MSAARPVVALRPATAADRPFLVRVYASTREPELAAAGFKFARQKSKLAGVIRGSFFVIKGEY